MDIAPRPDRVVVVNDESVAKGGATALALLSIRLLRARGIPVTLICGDSGASAELAALGVEVIALGAARLLQTKPLTAAVNGLWNREAHRLVNQQVFERDSPRTVYHVHSWAQILSPSVFAALRPVAPRVVTHAHDLFLGCPNGAYLDFPRGEVCTRIPLGASCIATNCDSRSYLHKVWRVGRHTALQYSFDHRLGWGPVVMIHPSMRPVLTRAGLPPRRLVTVRNPASPWRAQRIAAEANASVVYVGRVDRGKGVEELARAATAVDMPLTVIGDGELRPALARKYPGVTFAGWLARDEIWSGAASARALVMPSLIPEPFGLVAAEASLSGLPVIISDRSLLSAEIRSGGLGLSYQASEPEALGAALKRMAEMPDAEVRTISERGFAREAALSTTPAEWAEALIGLYAGLLPRPADHAPTIREG